MPAYNFKDRFADLVELGRKPHTIRPRRKRPTKPGDTLFLYRGQRRPDCRLLRVEQCIAVSPIMIAREGITCNGIKMTEEDANELARCDGFAGWLDMRFWFEGQYGLPTKDMDLICWEPCTYREAQEVACAS